MSLASTLRAIATKMLEPGGYLQDIPVEITYYSGTEGALATYDPVTQTMTRSEATGAVVHAVITEPTEMQVATNPDILRSDRFFYISNTELVAAGIDTNPLRTSKPQDRIVYLNTTYHVVEALTDAVEAVWEIRARRP